MQEPIVRIAKLRFSHHIDLVFDHFNWQWPAGQHLAILGGNGCGKTTLAGLITNQLQANQGEITYAKSLSPKQICLVSFDQHRQLMEYDRRFDDSETREDAFDRGTTVRNAILQGREEGEEFHQLCQRLGIEHILEQGIRFISTGESRKTLLARALISEPAALILDNPLEGLDKHAQQEMRNLLDELVASPLPLLLLVKDADDIPEALNDVQIMAAGKIIRHCSSAEAKQNQRQRPHFSKPLPLSPLPPWPAETALIELNNVSVNFRGKQVLSNINWRLYSHQHCCISGPNGAGKSTLLGLLYGDNDKAWGQHVTLFGKPRGSGESIWDIKEKFGLLNTSLQLNHLKRIKVIDVVASGLFDSVGLYQNYGDAQRQQLLAWLDALELSPQREQRFDRLSFGEQRMVLLARAMVKSPPILILDEPCIGLDGEQKARLLGAVDHIAAQNQTRILFVSHRSEDIPDCINQYLDLVPTEQGGYTAVVREI